MGIECPSGPYSVEMTTGPAWPWTDEDAYRDRATELRATLAGLSSICEQWELQRARLFLDGQVWSGNGATAAAAEIDQRIAAMHTLRDQLHTAATNADNAALVITAVKTQVTDNVHTAQSLIAQIKDLPEATDGEKSTLITQIVTATRSANIAEVAAGAAALGAQTGTPLSGDPGTNGLPQAPAPSKDTIPPPGTDSEKVKQWWKSLTPSEREAFVRDHPDEIGHLDGVPPPIRDQALRSIVAADRARVDQVAADRHVSIDEIKAHPENYGLTTKDILRYDQAGKANDGLKNLHDKTGAPTVLLVYKPEAFNGQGRAAIVIGDPERAANVAVVVPGTSHSLAEGWLGNAEDPWRVYKQMERFQSGGNAVYAWMGYDAPDSLTDPRVATTSLAREGGKQLANDVNGLRSTALVSQHYTVIGHSYGSTTVADAAVMGMKTNDVVLIGSPGTDLARNAADFHLPNSGHVFVGATSTDPVTHIEALTSTTPWGSGALGADPAVDGYGSTRFKAEVMDFADNKNAHSHYYDAGSESLRSIGYIASGNGDALESHGLTATHRDQLHLPGGLLQPQPLAEQLAGEWADAWTDGNLTPSEIADLAHDPARVGRVLGAVETLTEDIYDDPEFRKPPPTPGLLFPFPLP